MTCIAPVRFSDGMRESFFAVWHDNQMDMVRHEAISPDSNLPFVTTLRHQSYIECVIVSTEESLLAPITSLREMMRHAGHYDSRYSGHPIKIS